MGACTGKGANSQNNVVKRERRRLSVSKADDVASNVKTDARGNATSSEGNLLDQLFPSANKKMSVCGVACDVQQKGFCDKKVEKCGESSGSTFKVGFSCKKGLKPESPNQDDFCIFHADSIGIFGVFDGHGPYGHDISNFVQQTLPRSFVQDSHFRDSPEEALSAAFPETHRLCIEHQTDGHFDATLSGTTATLAMYRDSHIYIAHVGDSRAVLARHSNNEYQHKDLTNDHKPTVEEERKRIRAAGGQVRRLEGDIPHRVFVNGKMYPGLAMTRSIGDTVGTSAGVTSMPDVTTWKVEQDWRFLLMCSDGIWEFISSQAAVEIVARHPPSDAQKAAEELASQAWNHWIQEEGNVVDDITVIVIWFTES